MLLTVTTTTTTATTITTAAAAAAATTAATTTTIDVFHTFAFNSSKKSVQRMCAGWETLQQLAVDVHL